MNVKIKLLDNGLAPTMQHKGDVCFDCYSAEDELINYGTRRKIKLGFALQLPEGYEAVIRPRSGLSAKGIDVAIGTVDTNYRGEVMANVINNSSTYFEINKGDRICQLAIRPVPEINWEFAEELDSTDRGDKGFGSTGV